MVIANKGMKEHCMPRSPWGRGGMGDSKILGVTRFLPSQKERHAGSLPCSHAKSELKAMDAPGRIAVTSKITSNQLYV